MKRPNWFSRADRWFLLAGIAAAIGAAIADPRIVARLTPDGQLHAETILTLTWLRLGAAALALALPFWRRLDDPALRRWLIVLLLGFTVATHLVRINVPIVDQHAHRQTTTASIARNFYETNANILYPEVNWRADIPNYIESEFPLLPWLAAAGYRLVGEQPWVPRVLVLLATMLGIYSLFALVTHFWGQAAGFFAGLTLAMSPLWVFFAHAFMPDVPSLSFAIAALWFTVDWTARESRRSWWLAAISLALALLIKLTTAYVYLPVLVLLWLRWRGGLWRQRRALLLLALPLLPVIAWYAWARYLGLHYLSMGILTAPGGIQTEGFLKLAPPSYVLRWAFVQRIGGRVIREVLTPAGALLALLGIAIFALRRLRGRIVFASWPVAVGILIAISGVGQWLHNYYQLPVAPALAPFVGLGLFWLWQRPRIGPWLSVVGMAGLLIMAGNLLPWYFCDYQWWVLDEIPIVQQFTREADPVVTITYQGDTTLSYQLHRRAWIVDCLAPEQLAEVPDLIAKGAKAVILQDIERPACRAWREEPWLKSLQLVAETDRYAIFSVP